MIGIVAAMDVEYEYLRSILSSKEELKINNTYFYKGYLEEKEVVLVKLGIGKVNASYVMTLLLSNFKLDLVINTGIAGGKLPLNVNDIIVSDKLYYADVDLRGFGYTYGLIPGEKLFYKTKEELINKVIEISPVFKKSNICTSDKFVTSIEPIKDILEVDNTITVIDMESTVVANISTLFNTDFIILRSISDIIDKDTQMEDYNEKESAKVIQESLLYIVKNI